MAYLRHGNVEQEYFNMEALDREHKKQNENPSEVNWFLQLIIVFCLDFIMSKET